MGMTNVNNKLTGSRRSYEILLEHCPEKAVWEYIKAWEADIPRRYGDKVITHEIVLLMPGDRITRRHRITSGN